MLDEGYSLVFWHLQDRCTSTPSHAETATALASFPEIYYVFACYWKIWYTKLQRQGINKCQASIWCKLRIIGLYQ